MFASPWPPSTVFKIPPLAPAFSLRLGHSSELLYVPDTVHTCPLFAVHLCYSPATILVTIFGSLLNVITVHNSFAARNWYFKLGHYVNSCTRPWILFENRPQCRIPEPLPGSYLNSATGQNHCEASEKKRGLIKNNPWDLLTELLGVSSTLAMPVPVSGYCFKLHYCL